MQRIFLLLILLGGMQTVKAQRLPDHIYMSSIKTPKLFQQNNQQSLPLIALGSADLLELHFDDMVEHPRNFFYTFVLCNADWTPANVSVFDYIKGFTQNRLSQYRVSTIAKSKYVHYQALLPERNCIPVKSGNYLLKVFLDGDTSKLAFTKRMMVADNLVSIGAQVEQPFDSEIFRTHQKIQVSVNTLLLDIPSFQQTQLVILQNNRWDNAVKNVQPTFIRNRILEYNAERDCVFPAGKEYRWADLQSFRFQSDRIEQIDKFSEPNEVYIRPDLERNNLRYVYFRDRNGFEEIMTTESVNPWWQTDYAYVHFTFSPANHQPFAGKSVYMIGGITGNEIGDTSRMQYDAARGVYTRTYLLKQGYYSYAYVTKDNRDPSAKGDVSLTEGNYWETENEYAILFYYRPYTSRHDELLGVRTVNSTMARKF